MPDFASSSSGASFHIVTPRGVPLLNLSYNGALYWCGNVSRARGFPSLNFFAVLRDPDFAAQHYDPYSPLAVDLSHALGALFAALLALTLLFVLWLQHRAPAFYTYFLTVPCFLSLCVFRVVYCFALPSLVWVDRSLASFVVFELPTFLYFTALSCLLLSFLGVLRFFHPSVADSSRWLLYVVLLSVWCLFVAVVVSDASLLGASSACPGRIPPTTHDAALRDLSIAYQSILIFFTVFQVLFLVAVVSLIFRSTAAAHPDAASALMSLRELIRDCALVSGGFLARCILLIVYWSADLDSSVYVFLTLFFTEVCIIPLFFCSWIPRLNRPASISTAASTSSLKLSDLLWDSSKNSSHGTKSTKSI